MWGFFYALGCQGGDVSVALTESVFVWVKIGWLS